MEYYCLKRNKYIENDTKGHLKKEKTQKITIERLKEAVFDLKKTAI